MAIAKTVRRWERVVPLRFARAPHVTNANITTGTYNQDAPEPDERGFRPTRIGAAELPVGIDTAPAAAPIPETRVRLIRVDIENPAQLFVTTSDATLVTITLPAANAALPNQQNMMIKFRAIKAGSGFLEVRFGTIDGPIIHRIRLRINGIFNVRMVAHTPTINGPAFTPPGGGGAIPATTIRNRANIVTLLGVVNHVYFPYGMRLVLDPGVQVGTLNGFSNQGMVDDLSGEFNQATALNRVNHAVNAYFVPQIANPTAAANATQVNLVAGVANSARTNRTTFGLFVADWAGGQVVAHELGHLLNLPNDPRGNFVHINTVSSAAAPGTGRAVRDDVITRSRLMYSFTNWNLAASTPAATAARIGVGAYRDDVGYGVQSPGGMLTTKQLRADRTDQEMQEAQRTARRL